MPKLNSPFPWVGGKRLLRNHIISLIPEHRCYVEAFAGGAWVYWGKEPSKVEVINDINGDLINLYKQIQDTPMTSTIGSGGCSIAARSIIESLSS